jgi:uncharacterized protein YidB (DUF937 family)
MGLLDNLESLAGGASSGDHASVASELMNAVQQHPGGLSGILQNFQQNGMGEHVNSWQQPNQENQPITPDQAQQGLGSGVIDSIAQRTGLSPTMVKGAAAVILPMMVAHFAQNGGVNQQPSGLAGLASGFLSKFA